MMESFSGGAGLAFSGGSESDVVPEPPDVPVTVMTFNGETMTFNGEIMTYGEAV